jgi:hypothetical protein
MGHSSTKAALIYLHSTDERQCHLADAVGEMTRGALSMTAKPGGAKRYGTNVARRRTRAKRRSSAAAMETPADLLRRGSAPERDSNVRPTA